MVRAVEEEQEILRSCFSHFKGIQDNAGRQTSSFIHDNSFGVASTPKSKKPSDMELMKEKFAKLLLGEDMSGGGKGVSSALALSNAITNLAGWKNPGGRLLGEGTSDPYKAHWPVV